MHVLIIGGSGFIGSHLAYSLLQNGHQVRLFSRSPKPLKSAFKPFTSLLSFHYGDLNALAELDFDALFAGIDTLVYAAGADERVHPTGDAYAFFYQANVSICRNIVLQAQRYDVTKVLITGSVFAKFAQDKPELKLADKHPYIRSRLEQEKALMALANPHCQINIAQIPYVFGDTGTQTSLWHNLVNYVRFADPLVITPGGANMISIDALTQALYGILSRIEHSAILAIGDENLSWFDVLARFNQLLNTPSKAIKPISPDDFKRMTLTGAFLQDMLAIKSGLDHRAIDDLILQDMYFDSHNMKVELGYQGGDIDKAFEQTIKACPKSRLVYSFVKPMNLLTHSYALYLKGRQKLGLD